MKKIFLFILAFSISLSYCYSQPNKINEKVELKKELIDSIVILQKKINVLEKKLMISDSIYYKHFKALSQSLDSTKRSIDDTRLRESLISAEAIINKQNSLIDGFSNVFSILTIFIGLLAFGIPILIYFLTIKPANKALKKAKLNFVSEIKNFNEEQINEAIENLKSKNNVLIRNSLNHILSLVPKNRFSEQQVYRLFSIVKYENIDLSIKESIAFILINYNFPFCKNYFYDLISEKVETIENNNLKNYAFNYLIKFHRSEVYLLANLNQMIISSVKKKESLLVLLDWLVPDNEAIIWRLLSFEPLINLFNLDDLNFIYKKMQEKDYIIQDSSIDVTNKENLTKLREKLSVTNLKKRIETLEAEKSKKEKKVD